MSYTPIPKKKIVFVDASSDTTVPAGSSETITIQPPQGKIWRIVGGRIYSSLPAGATAGNHSFSINHGLISTKYDNLVITGNYDVSIDLRLYPQSYTSIEPNDTKLFFEVLTLFKWSSAHPLIILYENSTDVDQTHTRLIKLIVEEEDEAP